MKKRTTAAHTNDRQRDALRRSFGAAGAEIQGRLDEMETEWSAVTDEPFPGTDIGSWRRVVSELGFSFDTVFAGKWTIDDVFDIVLGKLKAQSPRGPAPIILSQKQFSQQSGIPQSSLSRMITKGDLTKQDLTEQKAKELKRDKRRHNGAGREFGTTPKAAALPMALPEKKHIEYRCVNAAGCTYSTKDPTRDVCPRCGAKITSQLVGGNGLGMRH
jgi:hypothetical protein